MFEVHVMGCSLIILHYIVGAVSYFSWAYNYMLASGDCFL